MDVAEIVLYTMFCFTSQYWGVTPPTSSSRGKDADAAAFIRWEFVWGRCTKSTTAQPEKLLFVSFACIRIVHSFILGRIQGQSFPLL
jgi:hypothetical protein